MSYPTCPLARGKVNASTVPSGNPSAGVLLYSTGERLKYRSSDGAIMALDTADPTINGFRLSLSNGVSVPTADVTGATSLYLTPHTSGSIALWDGTDWRVIIAAQVSLALSGLTAGKNYDVFAYKVGAGFAIELGAAWTSDTVRATAIVRASGVWTKSGDQTRRYVGTIRATAATTTEDSKLRRFVWNQYNQVVRGAYATDSAASYAYATAAWRQTNANTANRFEYVSGDGSLIISVTARNYCVSTAGIIGFATGIGIDSTAVNSALTFGTATGGSNAPSADQAEYNGQPGLDYHAVNWLEYGGTSASFNGPATWRNFGIVGYLPA